MHIATTLERAARLWPGREAVVCGDVRLDYATVARRVRALAAGLRAGGLAEGDRLAILAPNGPAFFEAYHAAAAAGLVLVPINTRLAGREVAGILGDSGARALVADRALGGLAADALAAGAAAGATGGVERVLWTGEGDAPSLDVPGDDLERTVTGGDPDAAPPRSPGDDALAQLYYTSGTTGRPKGVMLTHRNVVSHALGAVAELGLSDRDVWAHVAPMFHLADAWATFAVTMVGGRQVFVPRFGPAAVLDTFVDEGVTLTNLVPTMLTRLVHHPGAGERGYPELRLLLSGGAPIAPELVRRVMETFGCDYVQTYGMTETSPYLTLSVLKAHLRELPADDRFRYLSRTGREFVTVELRVVGADGRDVPADDHAVGEIRVRGDSVTPGYWNRPDETAAAFDGDWLRTGDLAVIDAEGYVNIVDRAKDMILTGGENVYSTEVENVLFEHPAVLEAAVVGRPDPEWGETVHAVVALRPGATGDAAEIIDFCRQRLARFKAPRSVEFVAELPRTGSGKIAKRLLR